MAAEAVAGTALTPGTLPVLLPLCTGWLWVAEGSAEARGPQRTRRKCAAS